MITTKCVKSYKPGTCNKSAISYDRLISILLHLWYGCMHFCSSVLLL